jgi:hypothetical protein
VCCRVVRCESAFSVGSIEGSRACIVIIVTTTRYTDDHVHCTGVVHLEGIAFDDGDAQAARLIIKRKVAGARRVVNELEICACDGGT